MCHHRYTVGRSERGFIVENVGDRLMDLADVVKQRDTLDTGARSLVEPGRPREDERAAGNTADMRAGHRIVGVNRVKKRFERCGAESLSADARAPLPQQQSASGESKKEWSELEHDDILGKKRTSLPRA